MWTGKIISTQKNSDGLTLTLIYELTDGTTTEQVTEKRVSPDRSGELGDVLKRTVLDAVRYRNQVEAQKAVIASFDEKAFVGDVTEPEAPGPSQADLDLKAFLAALYTWQQLNAVLQSGVSKTVTQQDVDSAYADMKTAYRDEYAPYLKGPV